MIRAVLLVALLAPASSLHGSEPGIDGRLVYSADYFDGAQVATAYDMILRLPGFSFDAGDHDLRGLEGSGGNVLVDDRRPATKQDKLDAILRRIPAAAVLRVELIRGGGQGIDMQGQPVVANVVRRRGVAVRGQVEGTIARYGDARLAPAMRADLSHEGADSLSEASLHLYREIDDEKGRGPRIRTNGDGSMRERAIYDERDGLWGVQATISHERGTAGGRLQLSVSASREHERADTDLAIVAPDPGLERVRELKTKDNLEFGVNWNRALGGHWSVELTGLQRLLREREIDRWDDGESIETVDEGSHGGESVARLVVRWKPSARFTLESGGEAAFNVLHSHSQLEVGGTNVSLPAADVRVTERRGEAFAAASWQPITSWLLEAGVRFETSHLEQRGDSMLVKSFTFPKPRLALTWISGPQTQWRLRVERSVSQLDFGDFVSSTSLTSSTITAGNADLEPERTWQASLEWERRFLGDGALVLTARHEWKSHTLDRVGVVGPGFAFDAPGNVGSAEKSKIEAALTLPLSRIGVAGGLLKAQLGYRWTSVIDPTTGMQRPISGEEPVEGELHFTQDRPAAGFRWGLDYILAEAETEFRFDEIRRERVAGRLSVFAEWRFSDRWTARLFAENLTGRLVERRRIIYAGARSSEPLRHVEKRSLSTRPLIGLTLRRSFGG